ncbi:MAG: PD40 domain-containing protein, partial [Gemmatimonadetes bacterium]|nr:PD40 domain-containing protein [Gemmatimonadota bacterium]
SVLYEMLAGEPPHSGGSAQAIIMKIIAEKAQPVTQLRRSVPPNVAAALEKALEKVPADRFESAKAFSDALGNATFTTMTSAGYAGAGAPRGVRRWVPIALAAAAGAALALVALTLTREEPARQVVRFTLELPSRQRLDNRAVDDAPFAISPDGSTIVYVATDSASGRSGLYVRALDQLEGTLLSSANEPTSPFFSPDGQWVGFFADGEHKLMKVAITGGPAITLATETARGLASGHWSDDDWIYYGSQPYVQIARVRGSGGVSERLVPGDTIGGSAFPFALPGGKAILASHCETSDCDVPGLAVLDLATREYRMLLPRAERGWYSPTGHLVYSTGEGAVFAVAFDPARGEMSGTPVPLLDDVRQSVDGGTRLSISASGTMIYWPGLLAGGAELVEVDRAGRETVLIAEPGDYFTPRWSPSRDRVAMAVRGPGDTSQIRVYDVGARTMTRLTRGQEDFRPSWSPDGRRIVFVRTQPDPRGLYWSPADGSAPAELVAPGEETGGSTSWTRDGAWILFDGVFGQPSEDVFAIGTGADRSRKVVVSTPGTDEAGVVSPDGRWVAYVSDESGRSQVYVRPFLRPGGRWLLSPGLAFAPLWASNSELTYIDPDAQRLVSVQLAFNPDPRPTSSTALLDWSRYRTGSRSVAQHDISRDGQRFLVLRQPGRGNLQPAPIVVLNWFEEIRRRVAAQTGARR